MLQLATYLKQFLQETYPGAKKSPVEMVKMMAMPDIKPDTAIEGKCFRWKIWKIDNKESL